MHVRIEVELKPEELRRFLGLPDVAGLQEDLLAYLRDRVGDANEAFNPTEFVRSKLGMVKDAGPWKRFLDGGKSEGDDSGEAAKPAPRRSSRRKRRDEE